MMKFLRSQSQTVLVVVLGVIAIGFLFYGNAGNLLTSGAGKANSDYGRINGEDVSVAQLYDAIRTTRDSIILQGQRPLQPAQLAEIAWARLLLLNEADKLHIQVSDKELLEFVHGQALFQKDGKFDPETFQSLLPVMKEKFRVPPDAGANPMAGTMNVLETVLRDNLRADAVTKALFGSVHSSAKDVSAKYEDYFGPTTVSVVSFDSKSYVASAQVTPADIEAAYKSDPQNPAYRTAEKRKVDYVLLLLSPEQAKLPDAEKKAAKDALGQKALDFAVAVQPPDASATAGGAPAAAPDFSAEAKKRGLNVATTNFFSAEETAPGVPPSPSFNGAAFGLSKDETVSKVVELDNGVAVLHLAEIQPSVLRPIDEVKPAIQKQLQQTKGLIAARTAADAAVKSLREALAKGTDFKTAAAAQKLKVETVPTFVPIKAAPTDQRLQTIAYAATSLKTGDVSEPIPGETDDATMIIHLDSRGTPDPSGLADFEKRFRSAEDQRLRNMVYSDWVTWKSKQPGTHKPPELEAYGTVE